MRPPAQDRLAAPGTAWLSGEARGRAVLAAPGSQAGSVAVALGDPGVYDVTSLATQTAVFDRTTGALVLLDPALGTIKERKPRLATRGTGFLVAAGTAAYIVDSDAGAVRALLDRVAKFCNALDRFTQKRNASANDGGVVVSVVCIAIVLAR